MPSIMLPRPLIICTLILFIGVVTDAQSRKPKACTWGDVDFCERFLSTYVGNPDNWSADEDKKSVLYCDFVKLRLNCLESLNCDVDDTPNKKLPLNITLWKSLIAPGLENMINLNLCADEPKTPLPVRPQDPCSEYSVTKRCMDELSDYLKSPYAMTCVAMLKAGPCFIRGRARCQVHRTASADLPTNLPNPYHIIAAEGRCRMIWDERLLRRQERWRRQHHRDN